ncbi:hypothetical protein SAMN05216315_11236 [Nitrosospira sp. Nsp18]|nr:hypothetical protein SAMN05216315_11236 [Nitrosospira sp. Nsp18]
MRWERSPAYSLPYPPHADFSGGSSRQRLSALVFQINREVVFPSYDTVWNPSFSPYRIVARIKGTTGKAHRRAAHTTPWRRHGALILISPSSRNPSSRNRVLPVSFFACTPVFLGSYELHDSAEQPALCRAHSGRRPASSSCSGCSSYGCFSTSMSRVMIEASPRSSASIAC